MKPLLILAFAICTTSTFGQTPTDRLIDPGSPDKVINLSLKVVYANTDNFQLKPAYFLNGKFVSYSIVGALNPNQIESIDVGKDSIQIGKTSYYGKISIKTKGSYTLKLISLTDLKDKYTNLKDRPVVFMIDGSIINGDYDEWMVDESNLLTIIVDKIEITKDKIDLGLIKLLTKSDENIKKSQEIRIRGTEAALID